MSHVDSNVDLGALARAHSDVPAPRRGRWAIALVLGLSALLVWIMRGPIRDLLQPPPEVTLARPVRLQLGGDASTVARAPEGAVLVQAAGWIEPDPFPTLAPALDGGVVLEVLVQESDAVDAGALVARLVDDSQRIQVRDASAAVSRADALLDAARVRATIAEERFSAALAVNEAVDRAQAKLEGAESEAVHRRAAVREGEAMLDLARSEVIVQEELRAAGASGARQVEIAEANVEVARARLEVLQADAGLAEASAAELRAALVRARGDKELRFTDRLERDTSRAEVDRAEAEVGAARAALERAELALERTEVRAPRAGVVLERLAMDGASLAPGAAVCSLYSPDALRVRVDVPQGDVERLSVGQHAEVLTDARPGRPYRGEVIRIVQRADIQKVTLEAQVRLLDADDLVRPDMLAQVRFFGARTADEPSDESAQGSGSAPALRFGLDPRLIDGDTAWVFDPVLGVARARQLEFGEVWTQPGAPQLREVLSGLNFTEEVIDSGRAAVAAAAGADGVARVRVAKEQADPPGGER